MPRNGSVDPRLLDRLKGAQRVGRGRGNHSALYWWMWEHYATLQTKAAQGGLPWDALLDLFAELGLTDADGRTPTRRTARDTYYRVCQDKRLRKPPDGDAKQGTARKSRAATYTPEPEGSTLPDAVQHPSGKPPDVRLAEAAARYAADQGKRRFPTGKPRALRMPTLGGSAPATEAGEGSVTLPRPTMPKPRLIHHQQGENEHGITERDADRD